MDEFAYGFVTENHHYGSTANPHDPQRIAGGSSGGSAAAVAAGLLPLTLGSDTNGSIRVPAALCGVFGLRPTSGRLSRAGTVLFAPSLDCIGPFGRSTRDVAIAFDVLQGADPRDRRCSDRPADPVTPHLEAGIEGLRIGVLGGYFQENAESEAIAVLKPLADALNAADGVLIPESHRARAAAYLITASEGAHLHLDELRSRPDDFDPATRDRFLAGALLPAQWYLQAQRFRQWYRQQVEGLFQDFDVLLAPSTPCVAPHLGQKTMTLGGREMPVRPHLGLFTQPISFVGLPVLNVPVVRDGLPLGVQLIAAPYKENSLFRVATFLEARKLIAGPIASGSENASGTAS
jgi:AtzE family amidohydrolase